LKSAAGKFKEKETRRDVRTKHICEKENGVATITVEPARSAERLCAQMNKRYWRR